MKLKAIVLCIDTDMTSNRKMLKALLCKNGAKNVHMAENGQEAVTMALADPQKFSIIFMDNLMPVLVTMNQFHTYINTVH